ncbi:MAG TPA: hypothetical protein VMN38_12425 [Sphingomicrobium sp.]|nr:hypothetical protein [Sphingomicrobium sp.]
MDRRVKWLAAAAVAAMAAGPASADNQWGNYHWSRSSNPLQLDILRQIGSQWDAAYTTAVADWETPTGGAADVLSLNAATVNAGVSPKKCNPISSKILVCADQYGFRGWLGIATIWANGDHIVQGTTKLNDSYHNLAPYNSDAWRSLVMCQEIGHDFGLDHQDENFNNVNLGSCQDYTNAPAGGEYEGSDYGPSNEHPDDHDYLTLEAMYAHTDGGGGGDDGGGGCNPRSPKCSGQDAFTFREVGKPVTTSSSANSGEWGRAIGQDGAGRPDTFQLDLGNGQRKITHVFWVPGFSPEARHLGDAH